MVNKSGVIDAQTLSAILRETGEGQVDVPHEDIGASIQAHRVAADLAVRLNCPYCHKPDTNDH